MQVSRKLSLSVGLLVAFAAAGIVFFADGIPIPLSIGSAPTDAETLPDYESDPENSDPVIATGGGEREAEGPRDTEPEPRAPRKGMDLHGALHRPGQSAGCRAIVFVFIATECPISNAKLPALNRMAAEFQSRGVEFYGVLSSDYVKRAEGLRHAREFGIEFPVLFDPDADIVRNLNATHSPHAFVTTSDGEVVYRGAIDDQYPSLGHRRPEPQREYLRNAVRQVLAEQPIDSPITDPVGCELEISRDFVAQRVTFARDIAPIIYGNCTSCHRSDAIAPFPLTSYEEVRKHASQIRVMVDLKLMPPWKPEHGFARFRDELGLTENEITTLRVWCESPEKPLGDPADLPPAPQFKDGWQLGEPDLVLTVPEPFDVPADGPDIYQYFVIPSGLTEDRMVTAVEYRSTAPQLVHHASFRWDISGQARALDRQFPGPGYQRFGGWGFLGGGTLGGWAVGVLPQRMPAGFGRPIKAGSDLVIQTHYHPSGKAQQDQASIGLYFAPPSTQRRIGELFVANIDLHLPPEQRRIRHHAEYTLPVDTTLHAVLPHMHFLGREATAVAILPDGRVEKLIRIPDWDFNWQGHYYYQKPIQLPAATRIEFDVVFDNSSQNPLNPHSPPRWVHWGEESTAEMAVCYFDVSTDRESDLDMLLRDNRRMIAEQERRLLHGSSVGK